jgi:hypothetical protein
MRLKIKDTAMIVRVFVLPIVCVGVSLLVGWTVALIQYHRLEYDLREHITIGISERDARGELDRRGIQYSYGAPWLTTGSVIWAHPLPAWRMLLFSPWLRLELDHERRVRDIAFVRDPLTLP